jgi:hypothetical protein
MPFAVDLQARISNRLFQTKFTPPRTQCQPDQFAGGLIGREMATRFDDLAQPRVNPSLTLGTTKLR